LTNNGICGIIIHTDSKLVYMQQIIEMEVSL
jgi:hypothetical protein